jgi:hypothetical protein
MDWRGTNAQYHKGAIMYGVTSVRYDQFRFRQVDIIAGNVMFSAEERIRNFASSMEIGYIDALAKNQGYSTGGRSAKLVDGRCVNAVELSINLNPTTSKLLTVKLLGFIHILIKASSFFFSKFLVHLNHLRQAHNHDISKTNSRQTSFIVHSLRSIHKIS